MANVDGIRQELVKADWSNLFAGKGSSGKWEKLKRTADRNLDTKRY